MSVTKPARWAVSPGMVDPKWQWAWRESLLLCPLWDLSRIQQATPTGLWTQDGSGNNMKDYVVPMTPSDIGPVWNLEGFDVSSTGHLFETGNLLRPNKDPWSSLTVLNCKQTPGSDQIQLWEWGPAIGLRYAQSGIRLTVYGGLLDAAVNSGSLVSEDMWVAVFCVSPGGDGTTNSGSVVAYRVDDGGVEWQTTFGWNSTADTAREIRFVPNNGVNTAGSIHVAFQAFWAKALTDDEQKMLARDPFGPIRPSHSFSRDATWQDLNPTLRAIPGAADGP